MKSATQMNFTTLTWSICWRPGKMMLGRRQFWRKAISGAWLGYGLSIQTTMWCDWRAGAVSANRNVGSLAVLKVCAPKPMRSPRPATLWALGHTKDTCLYVLMELMAGPRRANWGQLDAAICFWATERRVCSSSPTPSGGDVYRLVPRPGGLDAQISKRIMLHLLSALEHIHHQGRGGRTQGSLVGL